MVKAKTKVNNVEAAMDQTSFVFLNNRFFFKKCIMRKHSFQSKKRKAIKNFYIIFRSLYYT